MVLVCEVARAERGEPRNEATSDLEQSDEHEGRHGQMRRAAWRGNIRTDLDLLLALVAESVPAVLALILVDRDLLLLVLVPGLLLPAAAGLASTTLLARRLMVLMIFLREAPPEGGSVRWLPPRLWKHKR